MLSSGGMQDQRRRPSLCFQMSASQRFQLLQSATSTAGLLAHAGFFARFQGYRTILLFGLVHEVPRVRPLHDMSVGVDDGILILAVHTSPLFVSISPTLVDRSWRCQSAQALRFASILCAGSAAISHADMDSLLPLRSSWRRRRSWIGFL